MANNTPAAVPAEAAPPAPADPLRSSLPERLRRYVDYLVVHSAVERFTKTKETAEMLRAETWGHADALAGPNPTPLERTLAETAAVSWLQLRLAEFNLEHAGSLTMPQALWHQRKIDSNHRRFLATLRTLAAVRKLAVPAIQLNIGANQVNVGS